MTASTEILSSQPGAQTSPHFISETPGDYAIEITGLTKTYRPRQSGSAVVALKGIDLAIPRGSIFGLLGPNGAGKSTTINILGGLVRKSAGQVKVWRHDIDVDPRAARASIGIVPQELIIDPFFTPRQALELQAGLYGVPSADRITDELLKAVSLSDKANAYARLLSGGMRRRLMVAKAMVHSPPILVLDEPTAGVDVELRQQLWDYVRRLNRQGRTILLTTHYLEEAQELCDRIAIINRGEVVANDTTKGLLRRLDYKTVSLRLTTDPATLPDAIESLGVVKTGPFKWQLQYSSEQNKIGKLFALIDQAGLEIADLSTEEVDLQDIFLELTRAHA